MNLINWKNDEELFSLISTRLFTAVVGDVMDEMGYTNQFLPSSILPLEKTMIVVGRAMPVIEADIHPEMDKNIFEKPFGMMLEALDDLKAGEVYICSGASPEYALWGELMATRAKKLGATGAVIDGFSRDTKGIINLGFPSFTYGSYAQDQAVRGKVIDFRIPLQVGQVLVNPGDIIFGDLEGVLVVPSEIEEEVFRRSVEQVEGEKLVKKMLEEGMSAKDAFEKFGIM